MDALEAVGVPELREALLFVRSRRRGVSADELAEAQSIHRNVARSRLARLAEAGLLVSRFERRTGRSGPGAGRPARIYEPAPEITAIEFPARHYEELVGLLAEALPERSRARRLREIGVALGGKLLTDSRVVAARDLRRGVEKLCDAIGTLGFQASVEEVGDGNAVIATPTCPLRPLVMRRPEAAEIDRGMWCGLVAACVKGVRPEDVSCLTRDCLDDHASCRVVLELRERRPARTGSGSGA